MSYSIKWKPQPLKFLNKLQKSIALRVWDKLDKLKENPFRYLKHYESKGYKLRIGIYRALIDVNSEKKILTIQVFDKRERIYKK